MLIALYERAVGLYASLVNVNAYHQPGVEAGKKAAAEVLLVQRGVLAVLGAGKALTIDAIARAMGVQGDPETIFHIVRRLVVTGRVKSSDEKDPLFATYSI